MLSSQWDYHVYSQFQWIFSERIFGRSNTRLTFKRERSIAWQRKKKKETKKTILKWFILFPFMIWIRCSYSFDDDLVFDVNFFKNNLIFYHLASSCNSTYNLLVQLLCSFFSDAKQMVKWKLISTSFGWSYDYYYYPINLIFLKSSQITHCIILWWNYENK